MKKRQAIGCDQMEVGPEAPSVNGCGSPHNHETLPSLTVSDLADGLRTVDSMQSCDVSVRGAETRGQMAQRHKRVLFHVAVT